MRAFEILIVEDHPFQCMYLQHLFNELGELRVDTAGTAPRRCCACSSATMT